MWGKKKRPQGVEKCSYWGLFLSPPCAHQAADRALMVGRVMAEAEGRSGCQPGRGLAGSLA